MRPGILESCKASISLSARRTVLARGHSREEEQREQAEPKPSLRVGILERKSREREREQAENHCARVFWRGAERSISLSVRRTVLARGHSKEEEQRE